MSAVGKSAGDVMVDAETLRDVMRRIPAPVTVVTAGRDEDIRGITIGSFASTSLDPPLISFNVEREAQMHDFLADASHFAVHLLSEDQVYYSEHFALPDRSGSEQFESVPYRKGAFGLPVLEGVMAVLYCTRYAVYDAGDHSIVVGEVARIEQGVDGAPLLYFNRSYRSVGSEIASEALGPSDVSSSETP
jgi:3-hydroxy-9,10-secoandrosta-1,3,5(10)-triene-9,17-dione monooxygenase reductase component